MRIGERSRLTGVSVESLHYYEQAQLLSLPLRSSANYRVYGEEHLEQVRFIRSCRSLDIGLNEIRQLLTLRSQPQQCCLSVNALARCQVGAAAGVLCSGVIPPAPPHRRSRGGPRTSDD